MRLKYDLEEINETIDNMVQYTLGYLDETQASETKLAKKAGEASIQGFYDFLDSMARMHPDMLHHVYEWDMVGDPGGRLYQLKIGGQGKSITINSDFLPSSSRKDAYSSPFVNKAEVMEMGIPVVVEEVNAQSLFFQRDGQEFFRMGPIIIENPGGQEVRGSFLKFFQTFYNEYFETVYLESINFYRHLSSTKEYEKNFASAVKKNGYNDGKKAAAKWINDTPGGEKDADI